MGIYTSEMNVTSATSSQSSEVTPPALTWRIGNAKLRRNTIHLSIPAGHTCIPWATECFAYADKLTGKITDGDEQEFRCYAASMEARYPSHRKSLWNNYEILQKNIHSIYKVYRLLLDSLLPHVMDYCEEHETVPKVRIFGTSGEFFHENLYLACLMLARELSAIRIYWYTKAIPLWVKHMKKIPNNVQQNASIGGRFDNLIHEYGLKYAKVVHSPEDANTLGLPLDQRDELASEAGGAFAQLIHGTQPKGSKASKALALMRKRGWSGFPKR